MSAENAGEKKKRRKTSIPFLIVVLILGLVGYFRGEEIMTYAIYLQEAWSHNSSVKKDREYDKQLGPAQEGQYDWVAPDAPKDSGGTGTAAENSTEQEAPEPAATIDSAMPVPQNDDIKPNEPKTPAQNGESELGTTADSETSK